MLGSRLWVAPTTRGHSKIQEVDENVSWLGCDFDCMGVDVCQTS